MLSTASTVESLKNLSMKTRDIIKSSETKAKADTCVLTWGI